MKAIGSDHIDYWQAAEKTRRRGTKTRFGIRVAKNRCWPLVEVDGQSPTAFGSVQEIPVEIESLPTYVRLMVDEAEGDPTFDLLEVLTGRKSFGDALRLAANPELKRMRAS